MAIRVRERLESRSHSEQIGGKVISQRAFVVYEDTGAALLTEDALARLASDDVDNGFTGREGGFEAGDPHPDNDSLFAQRPSSAERVEGHNDLVEIVWLYENVPAVPPGTPGDGEVGFVDENTDQRKEFVKLYRVPTPTQKGAEALLFPPLGDLGDPTDPNSFWQKDISGIPNDIEGFRTTFPIYHVTGVVTEIIEGTPNWPMYGEFANKRNSTIFFNGAVGKVVYTGATSRIIGPNKRAITHTFEFDEWFHLEQIARRDQDGKIVTCGFGTPPAGVEPFNSACHVMWRQPYPEKDDFYDLSIHFQP